MKSDFGKDFLWGVASAAYQIEGAWNKDGKGPSIWDTFTHEKGNILNGDTGDEACDFYHQYSEDLALVKSLGFDVFRFSIAWSRLLPSGYGQRNEAGFDFYDRVIDRCLELDLAPWITLFHWDLPQGIEDLGGWRNRDVVAYFEDYTAAVIDRYGDRVKHWMVLNEPMAFTALGYGLGMHAPGKRGFKKFLQSVHHTTLAQSAGARVLRSADSQAIIGSTFSTSSIDSKKPHKKGNQKVAAIFDVMLNRLFLEPALGMSYPFDAWPALRKIEKYMEAGDEESMKFDFDFYGLQNYTRMVIKKFGLMPWVHGLEWKPEKRGAESITEMGWEVYPEGIYRQLKQFADYEGINKIIITENGAAFPDQLIDGKVADDQRLQFYQSYLSEVLRAKQEGVPVEGYFAWTFMDNFEWAEGYHARFGMVYNDFETQTRTVKNSGLWWQEFLSE